MRQWEDCFSVSLRRAVVFRSAVLRDSEVRREGFCFSAMVSFLRLIFLSCPLGRTFLSYILYKDFRPPSTKKDKITNCSQLYVHFSSGLTGASLFRIIMSADEPVSGLIHGGNCPAIPWEQPSFAISLRLHCRYNPYAQGLRIYFVPIQTRMSD
ncbi:hypothetical protein SDC9_199991 [bioreactor metagenome]|uniref:Uncharacterized protein n=1 Tax=bioreactor metagenome TaxID=1076179 RepID=A0A645ILZ1_9ZZZZ